MLGSPSLILKAWKLFATQLHRRVILIRKHKNDFYCQSTSPLHKSTPLVQLLDRLGPEAGALVCCVGKGKLGPKHEVKDLSSRSDFSRELLAVSDCQELGGDLAKVGCRLPNNILGSSHLETELLKKAFLADLRADVTSLQLHHSLVPRSSRVRRSV